MKHAAALDGLSGLLMAALGYPVRYRNGEATGGDVVDHRFAWDSCRIEACTQKIYLPALEPPGSFPRDPGDEGADLHNWSR